MSTEFTDRVIDKIIDYWKKLLTSDLVQIIFILIIIPAIILLSPFIILGYFFKILNLISNNAALFTGIIALILSMLLIWLIPAWHVKTLKDEDSNKNQSKFDLKKDKIKLRDDIRKTVAQIIGGGFFVIGLFLAANTYQLNREGLYATRYSEAIELLKSENSSIRIGGLLILEDISKDSSKDYEKVIKYLAAHVRELSKELRGLKENTNNAATAATTNAAQPSNTNKQTSNANQTSENAQESKRINSDKYRSEIIMAFAIIKNRNKLNAASNFILDLQDSELPEVDLHDKDFSETDFQSANLTKANFQNATLSEINFQKAILPEADFRQANLTKANFRGATLSNANFQGANLYKADFSDTTLGKIVFDDTTIFGETFMKNVDLRESMITPKQLNEIIIDEKTILPEQFVYMRESLMENSRKLEASLNEINRKRNSLSFSK